MTLGPIILSQTWTLLGFGSRWTVPRVPPKTQPSFPCFFVDVFGPVLETRLRWYLLRPIGPSQGEPIPARARCADTTFQLHEADRAIEAVIMRTLKASKCGNFLASHNEAKKWVFPIVATCTFQVWAFSTSMSYERKNWSNSICFWMECRCVADVSWFYPTDFLQSSQGILKKGTGNPWEKNWVSILDSIAIPLHVPAVFCKNTWPLWHFLTFFDVNILPIIYGGFSLDHCMAGHVDSHLIISRENGFKEYKRYNQGGEGQDWCFPDSCCWKWPLKSKNCYMFDDKIPLPRSLSSKCMSYSVVS